MSPRRESGFTLIEIMIVMAIIVTLVGLVTVGVPMVLDHQDRVTCQNNLKQMGTMLVARRAAGGWPADRGAGFLLRPLLHEDVLQQNAEVYICPGDDELDPRVRDVTPEEYRDELLLHLSKFKDPKPGEDSRISGLEPDLISYAGRTRPVPKESSDKIPLGADRQGSHGDTMHHKKGLNVLYHDGGVVFRERAYLGVPDDENIIVGGGVVEKLQDLDYQPSDGR